MNSYNENLQASVLSTLSEQELNVQKAEANLDASMFSLYYAEGARITAAEELHKANENYEFQQLILEQTVIDSDLSTNVLSSVNLANVFIPESVNNTAVAAANIQIAANAIVKLASDVGSIYSMINAADYGTEIYEQSKYANELMNGNCSNKNKQNSNNNLEGTAYLAENASRLSMEASADIAEVPIASLTEKTTASDTAIKALLEVVNTDFNAASNTVLTDTDALATANSTEKKAEGDLEDTGIVYLSTSEAYRITNKQLNLDLRVEVPEEEGKPKSYTVKFNSYQSPFPYEKEIPGITSGNKKDGYPVTNYYIFLVKNSYKDFFSVSDAEGLITEPSENQLYVEIVSDKKDSYTQEISIPDGNEEDATKTYLKDVNGQEIELGENYVVFVLATFENSYKKIINTFDDYLTAPSAFFSLKNKLVAPAPKNITVDNNVMTFTLENDSIFNVEYRCMFLLYNPTLTKGMLTMNELETMRKEVEELDELYEFNKEAKSLQKKIEKVVSSIKTEVSKAKGDGTSDSKELKELEKIKQDLEKELEEVEEAIKNFYKKNDRLGFFFNYTIAKGLEIESYSVAEENSETKLGKKTKTKYELQINELTTDSFGNSLLLGEKYIPVVLTMPARKDDQVKFIGALSKINRVAPKSFTYEIN